MQIIFHMLPKSSVINFSPLSSVSCVCFYKQIINKQPSEALNMANNAANPLLNIIQRVYT